MRLAAVTLLLAAVLPGAVSPAQARPSHLCFGLRTTITTGPGSQVIEGTRHRDVINSGSGNDVVVARGGNDLVCAGPGNDVVLSGRGRDLVFGGGGRDYCRTEQSYGCP